MKVVLIYWRHPQDVTQQFALMWREALNKLGVEVLPVDIGDVNIADRLARIVNRHQIDLVIAITPEAVQFKINDYYLWQILPAKFAVCFLDSPIYSLQQKNLQDITGQIAQERLAFFVADQTHMLFYQRYLRNQGSQHLVYFLPFAARSHDIIGKTYTQRSQEIVLLGNIDMEIVGTHIRGTAAESFQRYQNNERLFDKIVRFVDRQCQSPIGTDLLQEYIIEFQLNDSSIFDGQSLNLFIEVDGYVKRSNRKRLIDGLTDMPLTLYGANWDKYAGRSPDWQIGGIISYAEQFAVFENAKCVINIDPNWGAGTHDRAFNAMAAGATVLTPSNICTRQTYSDGVNVLLYGEPSAIPIILKQKRSQLEAIAKRGHDWTLMSHTWEHRMDTIIRWARL